MKITLVFLAIIVITLGLLPGCAKTTSADEQDISSMSTPYHKDAEQTAAVMIRPLTE